MYLYDTKGREVLEKSGGLSLKEFEYLTEYLWQVETGIVHTEEWKKEMDLLQNVFNENVLLGHQKSSRFEEWQKLKACLSERKRFFHSVKKWIGIGLLRRIEVVIRERLLHRR